MKNFNCKCKVDFKFLRNCDMNASVDRAFLIEANKQQAYRTAKKCN